MKIVCLQNISFAGIVSCAGEKLDVDEKTAKDLSDRNLVRIIEFKNNESKDNDELKNNDSEDNDELKNNDSEVEENKNNSISKCDSDLTISKTETVKQKNKRGRK